MVWEPQPRCNKATLTLEVRTKDGVAFAHPDIILYRSLEWKISSFFRSIGQKKHGERLVMDWNMVIGCRGRAHFHPVTYTGKDGVEHQKNEVDCYLDYDEMRRTSRAYAEAVTKKFMRGVATGTIMQNSD